MWIVSKIKGLLPENRFARGITVFMIAAAFTKVVSIVSAPIVTRLYSPADYGVLSVYLSTIGILSVISSLAYEQAILLPKDEKDAVVVVVLSILVALAFLLVTTFFVLVFPDAAALIMGTERIKPFLFLVPLGIAGAGVYNVSSIWANRNKEFSSIAKTQMTQALSGAAVKVGLGLLSVGGVGLLIGQIVSVSMGWARLGGPFLRKAHRHRESVTLGNLASAARRYWVFPAITAPSNLVMAGSMLVPAILMARVYGPEVAGWYGLATGTIGLPVEMIANSTRKVFSSTFSEALRNGHGTRKVFGSVLKKLTMFGIPILVVVWIAAPSAFSLLFGKEWEPAGEYARILGFYYVGQMITKPIAVVMVLMELRGRQMFWSLTRAAIVLTTFLAIAERGRDPSTVLLIYSIASFIYYLAIAADCWRVVRGTESA